MDIGLYFTAETIFIWNTFCQAHAGQYSQLDFGNVQPATVLGRVMEFQSSRYNRVLARLEMPRRETRFCGY
jgi:hypothetical protein